MSDYRIKGLKPQGTVTTIKRNGKTFHVHRPVLKNGFKANKGWQFSHEEMPVSLIAPPLTDKDTREEAIAVFDYLLQMLGDRFEYKFAEVKQKNGDLFKVQT